MAVAQADFQTTTRGCALEATPQLFLDCMSSINLETRIKEIDVVPQHLNTGARAAD